MTATLLAEDPGAAGHLDQVRLDAPGATVIGSVADAGNISSI